MRAEKLYRNLPVALQNLVCSLYGLRERRRRMGRDFWDYYEWLQKTESRSRGDIDAYQDKEIAKLIRHAYSTVPYYRRVMDERGLVPADVKTRADLRKLPVLRKEDVFRHHDELHSSVFSRRRLISQKTSGTTGTALSFPTTKKAMSFRWAIWWRHRRRFGVEPHTWHLNFTGKPVVPSQQDKEPYWRWNLPMRQAVTSMQHMTVDKSQSLAHFIDSQDFKFSTGYPSIVHSFCDLLESASLTLSNPPEHVLLGAEHSQEHQKASIRNATGAVVSDHYGFTEGCGNAARCERDLYHEDWEYGFLESVESKKAKDGRHRGSIVGTGFANYAFPFIRYEVGDTATWASESYRCECGRESRVMLRIEGRKEDYVVTPEGARIRRFDYLFKETQGIREAQVIQRQLGVILIRVVPRKRFSSEERREIKQKVRDWISPQLHVEFEKLDRIPRSSSGKFRPVVSELDRSLKERCVELN